MAWDPRTVYKVGVSGPKVREIQAMVNFWRRENGMPPIAESGTYTPETAAAVKDFQTRYIGELRRFGADGKVAAETGPILDKYARDKGYSAAPIEPVQARDIPEEGEAAGPYKLLSGGGQPAMDALTGQGYPVTDAGDPTAGRKDAEQNAILAKILAADGPGYGIAPPPPGRDIGIPDHAMDSVGLTTDELPPKSAEEWAAGYGNAYGAPLTSDYAPNVPSARPAPDSTDNFRDFSRAAPYRPGIDTHSIPEFDSRAGMTMPPPYVAPSDDEIIRRILMGAAEDIGGGARDMADRIGNSRFVQNLGWVGRGLADSIKRDLGIKGELPPGDAGAALRAALTRKAQERAMFYDAFGPR